MDRSSYQHHGPQRTPTWELASDVAPHTTRGKSKKKKKREVRWVDWRVTVNDLAKME